VNLPGVVVDLPTLTEKDVDDIVNWGVANEIDLIAASFVRKVRVGWCFALCAREVWFGETHRQQAPQTLDQRPTACCCCLLAASTPLCLCLTPRGVTSMRSARCSATRAGERYVSDRRS
jgi:hypothetical protein